MTALLFAAFFAFLTGGFFSGLSGFIDMRTATMANCRWRCTFCETMSRCMDIPLKKVRPVKTNVLCTQIFSSKPIDILDKVRYYLHL